MEVRKDLDAVIDLKWLRTGYARRAAAELILAPLRASWHIHGVGLDGGETETDTTHSVFGPQDPTFAQLKGISWNP